MEIIITVNEQFPDFYCHAAACGQQKAQVPFSPPQANTFVIGEQYWGKLKYEKH